MEQLPAARRASEMSGHFRELMTLIRGRTDATAKGLAAVGTAAVSAIGYVKLTDFFPYEGPLLAAIGLGLGLGAMVFAVITLVHRFERSAETVLTTPDAERSRERSQLDQSEFTTLTKEYDRMAELNGVDSLRAYNARAHRFERIADTSADSGKAAELRGRADAIRAEVIATQDRAVVYILRERAKRAFFHVRAILLLLLFLAGWYATALAADALQAERAASEAAAVESSSQLLAR
jgi:hypothetical protein